MNSKKSIKKVIEDNKTFYFDFDGTLVYTENLHKEAVSTVLKELGLTFYEESYYKSWGRGNFNVMKTALEDNGVKMDEEKIKKLVEKKEKIFLELAEKNLREVEGASDFLSFLKDRGKTLVITSGYEKKKIEKILQKLNMLKYFNEIITTKGLRAKPFPDVYLKAKFKYGDGIAFEDSPNGIKSALSAGIDVIAIASSMPKAFYYACFDNIMAFKNFKEIMEKIKED